MVPRISVSSHRTRVEKLTPEAFAQFGDVIQNAATHDGRPIGPRSVKANQGSATKWVDVTQMKNFYHWSSSGKPASVKMNMFVCKPRQLEATSGKEIFRVKILERHPFTPQTFVPMGLDSRDSDTAYLVIVAPSKPAERQRTGSLHLSGLGLMPSRRRSLRERFFGAGSNCSQCGQPSSSDEAGAGKAGTGLPDTDNIRAFIARGDQAVTYGAGTWHAPMVVLGKKPIEFVVVQFMNGVSDEDVQELELENSSGGESQIEVEVDGLCPQGRPQAKL